MNLENKGTVNIFNCPPVISEKPPGEPVPPLGVCPSNTKMAVFGGSKTPPRSPIVDPGAFYEVVF
jgi:hypothetical protein